jgi:tetratricopeptide (TPR) repeat protein
MNLRTKTFYLVFILLLTGLVYSNHFNNSFHFDDFHTINDNVYIRNIKNIPLFFKDASTTSTLPLNQAYRPGLTTLNAIDFYLAGKKEPQPFMFHVSIFTSYLVLGILCFLLFLHLLKASLASKFNDIIAMFATAWFLLHTANAETINYIIARSDSFSTLMIVLSFVLYIHFPKSRKLHLYFLPSLLGFFVKEPSLMFVPLLFVYKLFFEKQLSIKEWFTKFSTAFSSFRQVIIPLLFCIVVFAFSRMYTPVHWQAGGTSPINYLFTQPFVIFHYAYNFILPLNLVVDTDWKLVPNYHTDEMFAGLLFVAALLVIAFRSSLQQKTRPIAFGILWFFIALVPTSTVIPFAEVLNDHRTFFPYIGLFIAVACFLRNTIQDFPKLQQGFGKWALTIICLLVIGLHAYGTYQRNKVWATEESLWKEATIKAPNNGRGWMNYGNTLMFRGDYTGALQCYEKTTVLNPFYSYPYVNIGIAKSQLGDLVNAETNFKRGLELGPLIPDCYSFYGKFLIDQQRFADAENILAKGLSISPQHSQLLTYMQLAKQGHASSPNNKSTAETAIDNLLKDIKTAPTAEKYLDLSLQYYNLMKYEDCVEAAKQALKLKPDYDLAYNNICAAYNRMRQWDKAIEAGEQGLKLNPNNELLKGNLAEARREKDK